MLRLNPDTPVEQICHLPTSVSQFIRDFDNMDSVKPISFRLHA